MAMVRELNVVQSRVGRPRLWRLDEMVNDIRAECELPGEWGTAKDRGKAARTL